jgi:hypothetical protein
MNLFEAGENCFAVGGLEVWIQLHANHLNNSRYGMKVNPLELSLQTVSKYLRLHRIGENDYPE